MKYKIGDVAGLLKLTPEAIRYYEDRGIVIPAKTISSGYRYYGVWDIHLLIRARAYRQYGYSLAEAADLINKYEVPDIVSTLAKKEADIETEIIRNINLLKHIRQMQGVVADAYATVGEYRLEYRPAIYRIDGQDGYELHADTHNRKLYQTWIDKVPFVLPSALFKKADIDNGNTAFSFGLSIEEEYADFLDIKPSDDVAFYPPCLCVYTTLLSSSDTVLSPQKLTPALAYMQSKGMKLDGDVVSQVVLMNKKEDIFYSWHKVWMPIALS